MPKAEPRGMMVALCTGRAPGVCMATSAWPPSWKATMRRFASSMTADLRSAPMMILSLAYSRCAMLTSAAPSIDALTAAWFTRLASSAPVGDPRA